MKISKCKSLIRRIRKDRKQKNKLLEEIHNILAERENGERIFKLIIKIISKKKYNEAIALISKLSLPSWLWIYSGPVIWKICITLFFFIMTGALIISFSELYYSIQGKNWLMAEGVVLKSSIQESHDDGSTLYKAEIIYKYTVNEVSYTSNRRTFNDKIIGKKHGGDKIAADIVQKYPVNSSITVYYNPHDPQMSVLMIGDVPYLLNIARIIPCLVVIIVILISFIDGYKESRCPKCKMLYALFTVEEITSRFSQKINGYYCRNYTECIQCGHHWLSIEYERYINVDPIGSPDL